MSEKDELILNCWVAGTSRKLTFEVRMSANARTSELQEEIYNKNENFIKAVGLIVLSLQRVNLDIRRFSQGRTWDFDPAEFAPFTDLVDPAPPLSTHWQSQPPLTTLHVILRTTTKPIRTKGNTQTVARLLHMSP
ncbi:hypothetical protein CPB86DRAFT_165253 [Serendipita vermifera]|nr:hypothetical protein CPB86DRAFT_165253 [Serendipita vermifera]